MDCTQPGALLGPAFAAVGGFAFYLAFEAWRRPDSRFVQKWLVEFYPTRAEADPITRFLGFTRERSGNRNLYGFRIFGLLFGPVFFIVGCYMTIDAVACGLFIPHFGAIVRPLFGPLGFRFNPIMFPFIAIAVLITISNTWRSSRWVRILVPIGAALWATSGFEAAWFHTGVMAERWSVIAFAMPIVWVISVYFWTRFHRTSSEAR